MAKKKARGGKPQRLRSVASPPVDVEAVLDALDAALLAGDAAQIPRLTEPLWRARTKVPEVLVRRLLEGRAPVPAFAFDLLRGFAGEKLPDCLMQIAENRDVADIVRFGAHRRAGWPERGEARQRRSFLESLHDPLATLELAVAQGTDSWPPDSEILAEVLGYLAALPADSRREAYQRIVATHGPRAAWLVRGALRISGAPLQRQALADLVHLRDEGAAGAIDRLARTTRSRAVRTEAQAAAQRLQMHPVGESATVERPALPRVSRVYLSQIDGDGGQVAIAVREWSPGVYLFADVFFNEPWGIKDVLGAMRLPREELDLMMSGLKEQGLGLVEVNLAAARGALAAAVETNVATGKAIPPAYELWAPFYHDADPPPSDESLTMPELDDAPYAGRADLIRASRRLAEHPWFESWSFDPEALFAILIRVPPPTSGKLADSDYETFVRELVDDELRSRWRRRLRRQAWLLDRGRDRRARDQALAVAAQLATASVEDLARQPFLREILDTNIGDLALESLLSLGQLF